ncbi:hypothetical protein GO491_07210 [Flavobacteriaceae bacterium Ap0902]|nr:hypothetical protein [Flavobacteriaceae bacterium Ap0902]
MKKLVYKKNKNRVILGFVLIIIGIVSMFISIGSIFIAFPGIALLLNPRTPLVFEQYYLKYKPGLISASKAIQYKDIQKIDFEKNKIMVYGDHQKITIRKEFFNKNKWGEITSSFKGLCNKNPL